MLKLVATVVTFNRKMIMIQIFSFYYVNKELFSFLEYFKVF
jgi:hypothetical protein